jgi:EAL domain-containing protein (putative c-di-GMP-specific phosphodiesterase class I)
MAEWRAAGKPIDMAVNVSGRQLNSDRLIVDIETALAISGLEPGALTIEITETTLMSDSGQGFLFAKPLDAVAIRGFFAEWPAPVGSAVSIDDSA